eukprot:TRINITY_DN7730_c0_g1_i10.p1 TRINITY_DN7730_c0_g1~~TRINITY_DN7730_c0_g1_i10.p1  ORF type:complete len:110 (+),score=35.32 TRINITY_DN7730_c0_g1_i10:99-428(+)
MCVGEKFFKSKVILREWDDSVPEFPGAEFRGFVHEKKLNAVTQYFNMVYFPDVSSNKDVLARRILDFFEIVKDLIPHNSYVIDFLVQPDVIKVVELNPFVRILSINVNI